MKNTLLATLIILMVFSFLLAACDSEDTSSANSSAGPESGSHSSSLEEISVAESSEISEMVGTSIENSETSTHEPENIPDAGDNEIDVLYNSYSEKPYFAMVGTCTEGAVVTGICNGETVSSKSYKGWFSLRLKCIGSSATVILYETLDGQVVGGSSTVTATPKTPGAEMWPVVTGGDFQFFFQKMLPDFNGTNVPANNVFTALKNRLEKRMAQIRKYNENAEIIYLIVPSSMTAYPELVPESYGELASKTRLSKTIQAINDSGATAIDINALFQEHKGDEMPLYYKLDSHWSDYGAYIAYRALFDHISKQFPDAAPRSIEEFNWNPDYYESGDITFYLNMSQQKVKEYAYYRTFDFDAPASITSILRYRSPTMLCYSNAVTEQKTIITNRNNLPSCIVFRDSYSTQIYDILAERMNKTNYMGMWNYTWSQSYINTEKPDYIIYIVAEWNLDSVIYG